MHDRIGHLTPDGVSIGVIQDFTRGLESHTGAVDEYLRPVFEGWVRRNTVGGAYQQVRSAPEWAGLISRYVQLLGGRGLSAGTFSSWVGGAYQQIRSAAGYAGLPGYVL